MHMKTAAAATLVTAALLTAPNLHAHHGTNINYDRSKQWTAKAVVTEFKYVNPHAQLFFDVTDEKGNVTHWTGELLPNPAQLLRSGWTRKRSTEAMQFGTKIVVTVAPSRAGGESVLVLKIENENGEELLAGGPNAGGPEPPARPVP
jgi:Family of unknown function (DUF6152)